MLISQNKNLKGFIQIPILIVVIVGVLIVGAGGYFGVKQYQNYQAQKIEKEKQTQELVKLQQDKENQTEEEKRNQDLEIAKLKEEMEVLKNKKPETITQTIIKEAPATQKEENDIPSVVKQWQPIIGYIECTLQSSDIIGGSGTLVKWPDGRFGLLTNAHVVGGDIPPQSCRVIFPNSTLGPLTYTNIKISHSEQDAAILYINPDDYVKNIVNTNPMDPCIQKPLLGEKIIVIGYPSIGSRTNVTVTEGIVSGYDGDYYITSAKVEHGNSGGAAISIKDNCYIGIPSYVQIGSVESMARIFDFTKLR